MPGVVVLAEAHSSDSCSEGAHNLDRSFAADRLQVEHIAGRTLHFAVGRSLVLAVGCSNHPPDRDGLRPSLAAEIREIDRPTRQDERVVRHCWKKPANRYQRG